VGGGAGLWEQVFGKSKEACVYHYLVSIRHHPTPSPHPPPPASPSSYPPFTDAHVAKLKQLTLATLAARAAGSVLPYATLASALDTPPGRALDDLLIEGGLYTGLVKGRLDAAAAGLRVEAAAPRDVRRGELPALVAGLASWLDAVRGVAASLEAAGRGAMGAADARAAAAAAAALSPAAAAPAPASGPDAPTPGGGSGEAAHDAAEDAAGRPKRRR